MQLQIKYSHSREAFSLKYAHESLCRHLELFVLIGRKEDILFKNWHESMGIISGTRIQFFVDPSAANELEKKVIIDYSSSSTLI